MNRYQDFYNQQREWKGPNQQNRRSIFNNVRKERRTRMFDLFRGDIATYEPEAIKPTPKYNFRDTISKLIREKRKKVIQKPRPFVVGIVKHKIHSPPFLHEGCKFKEPKRKLTTPVQKSFAPSNYKFKIPKGLAINLETPLEEENSVISPFALNTVWNKLNNKNTRRKALIQGNITHRGKKKAHLDPSPNDPFITVNGSDELKNAKRELWPEAFDEGPIFGRLNLERMSRSLDSQPKDNEKEANDSSQDKIMSSYSVLPNSSFDSNNKKESDEENIQNLELKDDSSVEPNITSLSLKSIQNPIANTSEMFNEHNNEVPTRIAETTQMDFRLSRISPPKTILSNTIFNFDNSETYVEKDNTNLENINLRCSTPSVQNFFKDIQVQFENSCDPPTTSTPSTIQDAGIEATTPTISPVEKPLTIYNTRCNFIFESKRTLSHTESSENSQKILNLTFTKSLGLIEEDERDDVEEETIKLNLEYLNKEHKKEDNINSSPAALILHSSNVDKPNVESEDLHEAECNTISFDSAPKSKNTSLVIENNRNSKEISSPSKINVQDNCIEQTINENRENTIIPRKVPEKLINEVISNTSPALVSNQMNLDKGESLKESSEKPDKTIPKINIEINSSKKLDHDHSQTQETEQLIDTSTFSNSLTPFTDQPIEVNHTETIIESHNKDNCNTCNLSMISTSSHRHTQNKDVSSAADIESDHSQAKECEQLVAVSNSISSYDKILSEDQPTEVDCAKSTTESITNDNSESCNFFSVSTSNSRITENKNINSGAKTDSDHSQAKENEELVATTNSTSSNDLILFEDHLTEVIRVKAVSRDHGNCNSSCNSPSIKTSNHRITEETNTNLRRIVYSCPTKLIDNIESIDQFTSHDAPEMNIATPSRVEQEKDLAARTQNSPDSTDTKQIVSSEVSKIHTPQKTSPVLKIQIKITSPTEMKKPVPPVATNAESAHAGPVQSRDSISNEPIVDLTDSPISASRKSLKLEFRKSALDYKPSPLFLSKQKRDLRLSGSDENLVIDLISDDEDDHTAYLSDLLKKYAVTSDSPKQSPRNRTPLASIGNIRRLSASRTTQSPFVNKVYSPAKKTPVLIAEPIPIVHVSPPATPLKALHDTPCKTPRRRKALKEITTETAEVPSPLRVMNLRNRNISVSPSPNKKTPRAVTPHKTPVKYNAVKEIEVEAINDTGYLRVMNLRSRNVNVSPSPKKTPRRKKNDNQCA